MKKSKLKAIFSIVAVMLVITAFSIPAFAAESYYASDESGNTSIPSSIDSITISKADVDIPHTGDNSSNELTPNGNMSLIDDFLQMGGYIPLWFSYNVTRIICIIMAVYLSLNTVINFISKSKKEKYIITPLSFVTAICFWITAL